jgi:peptidoglycan/xylan/chitin deacetylase (PgdA/CDA1 family)
MRKHIVVLGILLPVFLFPALAFAGSVPTSTPPVVMTHIHTNNKVVALTFDADMTPGMLKRLQQKKVASWYNAAVIKDLEDANVPATLFLTGMWIEAYATTTTLLSRNPHFDLGNHSYSHGGFTPNCFGLNKIPESKDKVEVQKTDALLAKYATRHVQLFRFPGLCYDKDDVAIVASAGYTAIDADVYGDDGFQKNAGTIVQNVVSKVKPGSIVVLHMHGGPNAPETAVALPIIIQKLKAEGYTFVKVTDLLKYR